MEAQLASERADERGASPRLYCVPVYVSGSVRLKLSKPFTQSIWAPWPQRGGFAPNELSFPARVRNAVVCRLLDMT